MSPSSTNPVDSLNVPEILEQAPGTRPGGSLMPLIVAVILIAALTTLGGSAMWVQAVLPVVLAVVIVLTFMRASRLAARQRQEGQSLREVDESIRLNRWEQAGGLLAGLLRSPTQAVHARFQSLMYLGSVLNHQGRFEDVERVYDYLLRNAQVNPPISFSLRCARAYSILRQERLTDAYEAIGQLRRDPLGGSSAMMSLLEMYRLQKTGHFDEVLELFGQRREAFAQQLGHRASDAWALAAAAAKAMGRGDEAVTFARNALFLGRMDEMVRRFPETQAALAAATAARADVSGEGAAH